MKEKLRNSVFALFTTWIMWASYEIVEIKTITKLIEYKVDSYGIAVQANSEK